MANQRLILLGFEEGSVSYLIENALEIGVFNSFDIVINTDSIPENPVIAKDERKVSITKVKDYSFSKPSKLQVHFGVLHSHIKYILYRYFFHHFNITKEQYCSFIQPMAYFPDTSTHGKAFYIGQLSAVSSFSNFGFGVTIKKNCSIGHHCVFGDYVTVNPGAVVAGYCNIGEGTEIGTGATVSNNITIGKHCLIGVGSVVTRDIPDGVIAYGNPCKVIRKNERWIKADKMTAKFD